jgi:hypothetical protein
MSEQVGQTNIEQKVLQKKYIFCYLDIMGYRQLVEKFSNKNDLIIEIENLFKSSFDLLKDFQKGKNKLEYRLDIMTLTNNIKMSIISDSVLVRMSLDDLPSFSVQFNENDKKVTYIVLFLAFIRLLFILFCSKLGHFFRGAISIDDHYENEIDENGLFIFSKALIDAFQLEHEKAYWMRVLISDKFFDYLNALSDKNSTLTLINDNFIVDDDKLSYLNVYQGLRENEKRGEILKAIKTCILSQKKLNCNNDYIIKKYEKFTEYHNNWILKNLNTRDLLIDLSG